MADSSRRQLILCCDGTNNYLTGGESDTNVVRLCHLINRSEDSRQVLFYDPGVGNPSVGSPEESTALTQWDRLTRLSERVAGLAFGRGVLDNISGCYQFLMQQYQRGDEIYIFGFSRGAFTARSVAGLVNMFGILQPHMVSMIPTLMHVYFSRLEKRADKAMRTAKHATRLFSSPERSHVNIHFVGVWDSVASVGLLQLSRRFSMSATVDGMRVLNVRHALALDEHRAMFVPRQYVNANGHYRSDTDLPVTLKQLWFSGAHCDVGGGYAPEQLTLADQAMAWLVSEATQCGLRLDRECSEPLSEQAVLQQIYAELPGEPSPFHPVVATVHSELHATPLWAVLGLTVRTPGLVNDGADGSQIIPAEEHSSVQEIAVRYPKDTVWVRRQPWQVGIAWSLIFFVIYLGIGQLLMGAQQFSYESFWGDLQLVIGDTPEYLQTYQDFARWQIMWIYDGFAAVESGRVWEGLVVGLGGVRYFGSPHWALIWELVYILAYANVLSRFCVAGFARGAGLRRVGDPVPRLLNLLGWALPLMVFSDVMDNLFAWFTITLALRDYYLAASITGMLMSLLSLLKWVGLFGVCSLCLWPSRSH